MTESLLWRTSSHSQNLGGNCVELGPLRDQIAVRNSKHRDGADWSSFIAAAKSGGFDLPA